MATKGYRDEGSLFSDCFSKIEEREHAGDWRAQDLILAMAMVPLHLLVAAASKTIAEPAITAGLGAILDKLPIESKAIVATHFEAAVFCLRWHPEQVTCHQTDPEKTHGMTPILIGEALAANSTDFVTPALHRAGAAVSPMHI